MSLRWIAALAAFGLVVAASAGEKKKLDFAPETGPQPRLVTPPACVVLPPPPATYPATLQYDQAQPACPACAATRATARQMIRSYSVADLVIPVPPAGAAPADRPTTRERELIKKLTATVQPKSWSGSGGENSIDYFPLGMALVVNAPPAVHEAVEKYLDEQRRMQDTQFEIKLVVVTVTDAGLEKLGLARDFGPAGTTAGEVRARVKFLPADELPALDRVRGECVDLTAPTVTVLNGQEACAKFGQVQHFLTGVTVQTVNGQLVFTPKNEPHDLGVTAKVRATLSADGKFIKLAVATQAHDLTVRPVGLVPLTTQIKPVYENGSQGEPVPFTQFLQDPRILTRSVDETVTLPDGGTAVFYGGPATIEDTVRECPPMFSDVPFLHELFARDKKVSSKNHLLVFATSKVVRPADCDECVQCAGGGGKLVKLLAEYGRACREANTDEARRLAMECLVIDPTCFSKK
jgi:hypothetical protein